MTTPAPAPLSYSRAIDVYDNALDPGFLPELSRLLADDDTDAYPDDANQMETP